MSIAGLNAVEWDKLICRVGPATEVPKHLAALAIEAKAPEAFISLLTTLIHKEDHVVFPATAAAIPFIRAIAAGPAGPVSTEHALCLLRDLAAFRGNSYLVQGIPTSPEDLSSSNSFDRVPALVREGVAEYQTLLGHTSARVRTSAAIVVAAFATSEGLNALQSSLANETDPRARASLIIGVGLSRRILKIPSGDGIRPFLVDPDYRVSAASAIALALSRDELRDEEVDALEDAEETEFERDYMFWNEGRLDEYAKLV